MVMLPSIFPGGVMPALAGREGSPAIGVRAALSFEQLERYFTGVTVGAGIVSTTEAWKNPHVRACVDANSQAIAARPFKLYKGRDEIEKHWLLDLMAKPNPVLRLSAYDVAAQTVAIREIFGECFWVFDWNGREKDGRPSPKARPTAIWIYHPNAVSEVVDHTTGELLAWQFSFEQERFKLDPLDVLHFKRYDPLKHNPLRPSRGTSPLHSAMLAVSADIAAARYNLDFFNRGVKPGIIFMSKGELTNTQGEQFLDRIKSKLGGKSGEPLVLDGDWTVESLGETSKDAEFSAGRAMNRSDILEAFKVPPVVVGNQDAKYDNADAQMKMWWTVCLKPIISNYCSTIDLGLLANDPGLETDLDIEDVEELQKDKRERFAAAAELHGAGVPWDELDRIFDLGLGDFEGSDIAFVSFSLMPVGDVINKPEPDPEPEVVPPPPADQPPPQDMPPEDMPPRAIRVLHRSQDITVTQTRAVEDSALMIVTEIIRGDDEKLRKLAKKFHLQALKTGAGQVAKMLGITSIVPIENPRVVAFLSTKANQIISVNETTAERIMKTIREQVAAGTSPEEIGEDIRQLYNLRNGQARLIGRQEVGSALNGGRFMQMEEEGVDGTEWLTSRDARVRESHEVLDGEVAALGARFSNGCRYPQDPDGDPSEVIGCRCISLPSLDSSRANRINDRAAYWRAATKQVRTIETTFTSRLQAYLHTQRSAVLKALAELGVAA